MIVTCNYLVFNSSFSWTLAVLTGLSGYLSLAKGKCWDVLRLSHKCVGANPLSLLPLIFQQILA